MFKPTQSLSKLAQIKSVRLRTMRVCAQIRVPYKAGRDRRCVCSLSKNLSLQRFLQKSVFFCQFGEGWSVAMALLCADDTTLPVPALCVGVLVLFLDSDQVFRSNRTDSVWGLIDLETGVLQKALQWLLCGRWYCSCFASALSGVLLVLYDRQD